MQKTELKNNIKVQRAIKNITQEELAAAVGVTRKTINTIENGIYTPSAILAMKIARYFESSVEDIFKLDE